MYMMTRYGVASIQYIPYYLDLGSSIGRRMDTRFATVYAPADIDVYIDEFLIMWS